MPRLKKPRYIDPIPHSERDYTTDGEWQTFIDVVEDILFPFRKKAIDAKRAAIIADALSTPEGRIALASAMVEPLRRSMEYSSIGRQLMMVDELPQGAFASYESDVSVTAV